MPTGKITNLNTATGKLSSNISDHRRLVNRDAEDQHPIEAITGLPEKLKEIDTKWYDKIAEEAAARKAADDILQANIDTEATTRATKDTELAASIAEKADKTYVDAVSNRVSIVENDYLKQADKTELATDINTEKTRAEGKEAELTDRVNNLESRGRFLSSWNAVTGKPETNPTTLPYLLKAGDYFIVSEVGATNYAPEAKIIAGKEGYYYTGDISTTTATGVAKNDYYTFDGTKYILISNTQKAITFNNIAGQPEDNLNLKAALDAKQGILTAGANITIDENNEISAADSLLVYDCNNTVYECRDDRWVDTYDPNFADALRDAITHHRTLAIKKFNLYYSSASYGSDKVYIATQFMEDGGSSVTFKIFDINNIPRLLTFKPSGKNVSTWLSKDVDETKQDKTSTDLTTENKTIVGAINEVNAKDIMSAISYTTVAPTEDNPNGLKFVVLASEPAVKYNGYFYIITTPNKTGG